MVVGAALLRTRGAHNNAAVLECEFLHGKIGGRGCRLEDPRRAAERGIVPIARRIVKKSDLADADAGDIESLAEDEWYNLDADFERLGGKERRFAELGIVALDRLSAIASR
jgi:hypothetical protein